MPKKNKKDESLAIRDFNKVKFLLKKGTLDEVLSKLDPTDIRGTLKTVPIEVVRLMSHLLVNVKSIDQLVKTLKPGERRPIESLLKSARKNKGEEFAQKFFELAKEDEAFRKNCGIALETTSRIEAKIDNEIDQVYVVPHMMLKNKRIYAEVTFLRDDELLFRWNSRIENVLAMSIQLIRGVVHSVELAQQNFSNIKPDVNVKNCLSYLTMMNKDIKLIKNALPKFFRSSRKKAQSKKYRIATRSKTTKTNFKSKSSTLSLLKR